MLSYTLIKYSSLFLQKMDKKAFRIFLESSPLYPSLLSVKQSLQYAGIDGKVGQCDWDYLKELSSPFLLHLRYGKKENLVIAKWNGKLDCLETYNINHRRWHINERNNINRLWDGVVIYTDTPRRNPQVFAAWGILLPVVVILTIVLGLFSFRLIAGVVHYIPVVLGLIISGCLYLKSDLPDGSIVDRLCHISDATDCELVDQSTFSSINGFKMTTLALSFFISQLMTIAIGKLFAISGVLTSIYFISAAVVLPVIAYSAYGQFKIKKICPLCVLLALCIVSEALLFLSRNSMAINNSILLLYGAIFLTAVLTLQFIADTHVKETGHMKEMIDLLRLKRKKGIILSESTPARHAISPIWTGEENVSIRVTTVIAPNCGHCRKVVSEMFM